MVMTPYIPEADMPELLENLRSRLKPKGTLIFLEQDLMTDAISHPDFQTTAKVLGKDERELKPSWGLNMERVLSDHGMQLLPRKSFLWTANTLGPYLNDLLQRIGSDAIKNGRLTQEAFDIWFNQLQTLDREKQFYYGLVYHRVAAQLGG